MMFEITGIQSSELSTILELNESEVPHVGRIDLAKMHWFAHNADYFKVIRASGHAVAFLIGMRPGSRYQSPNYRWFCKHYNDFAYVDRVAVAPAFRRKGLASRLYDDFANSQRGECSLMTCEVNLKPPNEDSMQFHARLGFEQAGTLLSEGGDKEVALLVKPL